MAQVKDLLCYGPARFLLGIDMGGTLFLNVKGDGTFELEWYGTIEEYDAIATKDPNTVYYIIEN